jgi:hypothetical protein
MSDINVVLAGNLLQINTGLGAAIGFVNPLNAQLDAMLAFALGPFQADLLAQFNASVALQATLSLQISDPLAALRAALQALFQLQAALQASLSLPPLTLSVQGSLSASLSLSAALQLKLGLIDALIKAALRVKIPLMQLVGQLNAALNAGPAYLLSFDGLTASPQVTMASLGDQIRATMSADIVDPASVAPPLHPGDPVAGILLLMNASATFSALGAIIPTA